MSAPAMAATTVATAAPATPVRRSSPSPTREPSTAPGWPEARKSMVAVHLGRSALPYTNEGAAVPAGCAWGDLPIAHARGSRLRAGASNLRLAAWLQVLAHVASIAAGQGSV
jgi:hypothetical protein